MLHFQNRVIAIAAAVAAGTRASKLFYEKMNNCVSTCIGYSASHIFRKKASRPSCGDGNSANSRRSKCRVQRFLTLIRATVKPAI
jgi:hypothetical protein